MTPKIPDFPAVDPEGNIYRVVARQYVPTRLSISSLGEEMHGPIRFELSDGLPLNPLSGTEFEIIGTGVIITKA